LISSIAQVLIVYCYARVGKPAALPTLPADLVEPVISTQKTYVDRVMRQGGRRRPGRVLVVFRQSPGWYAARRSAASRK
jgi:hypothetical protein